MSLYASSPYLTRHLNININRCFTSNAPPRPSLHFLHPAYCHPRVKAYIRHSHLYYFTAPNISSTPAKKKNNKSLLQTHRVIKIECDSSGCMLFAYVICLHVLVEQTILYYMYMYEYFVCGAHNHLRGALLNPNAVDQRWCDWRKHIINPMGETSDTHERTVSVVGVYVWGSDKDYNNHRRRVVVFPLPHWPPTPYCIGRRMCATLPSPTI